MERTDQFLDSFSATTPRTRATRNGHGEPGMPQRRPGPPAAYRTPARTQTRPAMASEASAARCTREEQRLPSPSATSPPIARTKRDSVDFAASAAQAATSGHLQQPHLERAQLLYGQEMQAWRLYYSTPRPEHLRRRLATTGALIACRASPLDLARVHTKPGRPSPIYHNFIGPVRRSLGGRYTSDKSRGR